MATKKHARHRPAKPALPAAEPSSNDLYRVALDTVDHAIHVVDSSMRIVIFNREFREFCRRLKINAKDMIGKTVFEAFPFLPEKVRAEYARVFEKGKVVVTEESNVIDGREVITETHKNPIFNGSAVTHVVTILSDVTERNRAREALIASEAKYRLVVENVPVSIVVIDYEGTFLFVNSDGARRFGMTPEEVTGKSIHSLLHPDLAVQHMDRIRNCIDTGQGIQREGKTYVGGRWGWYDMIAQPFTDPVGGGRAALLIARDITQYKEAIEALRESEERFRLQFQSIPVPTFIMQRIDSDFILTDYNEAADGMTKGKIKNYLGTGTDVMIPLFPASRGLLDKCYKTKKALSFEGPCFFPSLNTEKYLALYFGYAPPDLVLVHAVDMTERKRTERELQEARDKLEARVEERTRELAEANAALEVEREALRQKNIVLGEVLNQIEDGKRQMVSQIQSNINRIALPVLTSLERKVGTTGGQYVELLRNSLADIASPLADKLESRYRLLTLRELEICHMVKNGLSCKEIAAAFNTSVQTVLKQRAVIRRKLGIANEKVNLESFLKSL